MMSDEDSSGKITKKGSKKKLIRRRKPHSSFKYTCEWEDCQHQSDNMNEFNHHVTRHRRGYTQTTGTDEALMSVNVIYYCQWRDCTATIEGNLEDFSRHVYYHTFHQHLKFCGQHIQELEGLESCSLGDSSRNLIPELPERLICRWDDCQAVYDNPYLFYSHVTHHTEEFTDFRDETTELPKIFRCKWESCPSTAKRVSKIKEHLRSHTQAKEIACPTCGSLFACNTKFIDHIKRQMTGDSDEKFQCSHCGSQFGSERILRDHMRRHVNHYKCPLCDMTCPTPSALRDHVLYRHSDERKFNCQYCDYKGKTTGDVQRHEQSLHGKKSFDCPEEYCEAAFETHGELAKHSQEQHGVVNNKWRYECHLCRKRFVRGAYVTNHLKNYHNYIWPSGHNRFRYKQGEDGLFRLQTVRYESIEVSQQVLGQTLSPRPDEGTENLEDDSGDDEEEEENLEENDISKMIGRVQVNRAVSETVKVVEEKDSEGNENGGKRKENEGKKKSRKRNEVKKSEIERKGEEVCEDEERKRKEKGNGDVEGKKATAKKSQSKKKCVIGTEEVLEGIDKETESHVSDGSNLGATVTMEEMGIEKNLVKKKSSKGKKTKGQVEVTPQVKETDGSEGKQGKSYEKEDNENFLSPEPHTSRASTKSPNKKRGFESMPSLDDFLDHGSVDGSADQASGATTLIIPSPRKGSKSAVLRSLPVTRGPNKEKKLASPGKKIMSPDKKFISPSKKFVSPRKKILTKMKASGPKNVFSLSPEKVKSMPKVGKALVSSLKTKSDAKSVDQAMSGPDKEADSGIIQKTQSVAKEKHVHFEPGVVEEEERRTAHEYSRGDCERGSEINVAVASTVLAFASKGHSQFEDGEKQMNIRSSSRLKRKTLENEDEWDTSSPRKKRRQEKTNVGKKSCQNVLGEEVTARKTEPRRSLKSQPFPAPSQHCIEFPNSATTIHILSTPTKKAPLSILDTTQTPSQHCSENSREVQGRLHKSSEVFRWAGDHDSFSPEKLGFSVTGLPAETSMSCSGLATSPDKSNPSFRDSLNFENLEKTAVNAEPLKKMFGAEEDEAKNYTLDKVDWVKQLMTFHGTLESMLSSEDGVDREVDSKVQGLPNCDKPLDLSLPTHISDVSITYTKQDCSSTQGATENLKYISSFDNTLHTPGNILHSLSNSKAVELGSSQLDTSLDETSFSNSLTLPLNSTQKASERDHSFVGSSLDANKIIEEQSLTAEEQSLTAEEQSLSGEEQSLTADEQLSATEEQSSAVEDVSLTSYSDMSFSSPSSQGFAMVKKGRLVGHEVQEESLWSSLRQCLVMTTEPSNSGLVEEET